MLTVKGVYENGQVRLLEPVAVPEPCKVQVTFVQADEPGQGLSPAQRSALAIIGLYNEMSSEQQHRFDEAMAWRLSFPQREFNE